MALELQYLNRFHFFLFFWLSLSDGNIWGQLCRADDISSFVLDVTASGVIYDASGWPDVSLFATTSASRDTIKSGQPTNAQP